MAAVDGDDLGEPGPDLERPPIDDDLVASGGNAEGGRWPSRVGIRGGGGGSIRGSGCGSIRGSGCGSVRGSGSGPDADGARVFGGLGGSRALVREGIRIWIGGGLK